MPFEVGNTLGQGRGKPITEAMLRVLKQNPAKLKMAIEAQLERASKGDLASLAWLTERMEGKPKGDDSDKSQLIQVVINGYSDVQARIVDNSQAHDHEGVGVIGGGGEAVGVVASRAPDDSLPIHEISELPAHEISELPTEKVAVDTAPSESDPPV